MVGAAVPGEDLGAQVGASMGSSGTVRRTWRSSWPTRTWLHAFPGGRCALDWRPRGSPRPSKCRLNECLVLAQPGGGPGPAPVPPPRARSRSRLQGAAVSQSPAGSFAPAAPPGDTSSLRRHGVAYRYLSVVKRAKFSNGYAQGLAALGNGVSAQAPAVQWQAPPMRPQTSGSHGPPDVTALVVDDDDDSREATMERVKAFGVYVHGARDGEEALQLLPDVRPDLILCDLQMPRLDGFGFVRRLRRTPPFDRVLTVAVTGLVSPIDLAATREAGFDGHVGKPISPEMIARLLERARRLKATPPQGA
jgi:two-component system, cell cycle response regulator DivK